MTAHSPHYSSLRVFLPLCFFLLLLFTSLPFHHSQPSNSSYRLVWSEDFSYANGTQPSSHIWNWETGGNGWGNNELEYYTARPVNSVTVNGSLLVQGLYESYYGRPYTSARLNTQGKVMFYQGYIAARATINMFNGFWPAIWAMGNASTALGWPQCGEIDFMEQVNGQSASPNPDDHTQFGTVHYNQGGESTTTANALQSGGSISNSAALWGSAWHVYAFEWTSTSIAFSVDNVTYYTAPSALSRHLIPSQTPPTRSTSSLTSRSAGIFRTCRLTR